MTRIVYLEEQSDKSVILRKSNVYRNPKIVLSADCYCGRLTRGDTRYEHGWKIFTSMGLKSFFSKCNKVAAWANSWTDTTKNSLWYEHNKFGYWGNPAGTVMIVGEQ